MKVGNNITTERANWSFGNGIAESFDEHMRRSIPLYEHGHELVCHLSDFFCLQNSICYELGTATGQLIQKLALHQKHKPNIRFIGIDREAEMVEAAQNRVSNSPNIELLCEDILATKLEPCDFVVAYYTIQFIPARFRQEIFNKVYQALNWGGAFVLFEKVRAPDARFQDMASSLYNDFKLQNGFSPEEIFNKTQSLKGVLEPFSTQGNLDLLSRAGFLDVTSIMKYVCFEGFLAIK